LLQDNVVFDFIQAIHSSAIPQESAKVKISTNKQTNKQTNKKATLQGNKPTEMLFRESLW
jgi:hypothetical protein